MCLFPINLHLNSLLSRWKRLSHGWVKLNTDGSSLGNPGPAGGGEVIRDEEGAWIVGFPRNTGITSCISLGTSQDGLVLCISRNFNAVEVELDA